jgi:hypothetical protein
VSEFLPLDRHTYTVKGAKCVKATDKALLIVSSEIGDEPTWVPISQVESESAVRGEGDEGELTVSLWLAEEKGWI